VENNRGKIMSDIREKQIAEQEAQTAHDSNKYFAARRQFYTPEKRNAFEEGHKRGYESRQQEITALQEENERLRNKPPRVVVIEVGRIDDLTADMIREALQEQGHE
jgi:flagellar biosynthesis/type III secretory pathway protein FliH